MAIPDTFATHNADKQWGTVYVEKPVLELAYTASDNTQTYEKIKIFGTVEEPKAGTWIHMTITEPSGKTSQQKVVSTSNDYYENFILICCNNIGKYSVYVEWKGYHIGTVTFNVIQKSTTQNPPPTSTSKTSTFLTLNPLPSTFEIKDQNSPGVGITFSGKLTTSDRQYVITNAKIQLQDIRSGQTVQVTTDDNGKFNIKLNRAAGSNYAVNAVFDGSLNFESSKSQTEYFDVIPVSFPPQVSPPQSSPQVSPPTEDPGDNVGGVFLLVIIVVGVIVVIAIKKRKKRIPVIIQASPSGGGFEAAPESTIALPKPAKVLPKKNKKTTEEIDKTQWSEPDEVLESAKTMYDDVLKEEKKSEQKKPRTKNQWGWYWVKKARSFGFDDLEETLKCYENAIDVRLDYYLIYKDKARLFHYVGLFDLAIENYEKSLEVLPPPNQFDNRLEGLELAKKRVSGYVSPWDSNYLAKHGTLPSVLFLKEKKLELEKLIPKDGMKTKKKKSHVNKPSNRFECKCGYHTCKRFYETEKERRQHRNAVTAQKTKELQASKDRLGKNEDQSKQNLLKECPKCGRQARTEKEIQGYFGYRMMKGVKHQQSWCRVCRTDKPDKIVKPKKNLLIACIE